MTSYSQATQSDPCCPLTPPPVPFPTLNAEASLFLSTQSCSTPWPCAFPHYRAVRKLLGAPVTLKDWWRKMRWRRGEEQVVKKRMSSLMGCQECNLIIMKSESGELAGWMDGWLDGYWGKQGGCQPSAHAWASSTPWCRTNRWTDLTLSTVSFTTPLKVRH